jgi:hypothetical protein
MVCASCQCRARKKRVLRSAQPCPVGLGQVTCTRPSSVLRLGDKGRGHLDLLVWDYRSVLYVRILGPAEGGSRAMEKQGL